MKLLEELKYRGLLYAVTDDALGEKLETESMTFYLGADPTADSLHIGHLVPYMVARKLVARGHKAILLVGGGTGLIGDPSGRSTERNLLSLEETMQNAEALKAQVLKVIPTATVVNNYDWIKEFDLITFLRDIGKHFNLNQMLAKDSVRSRMETGISFTEFTYQIIQSLDFLELYKKENCKLQIGGQDQWGNITAGLELIRKVTGHDKEAYGLVIPLITKADGTKFGKSAEGAIWLDANRTTPYAFYQYWINLSDQEAIERVKQFTELDKPAIDAIEQAMQETPHLRHAQKAVAEYLTTLIHGEAALAQALKITDALFNNDIKALSKEDIKMGLTDVPHVKTHEELPLIEALLALNLASSKREARTFIKQNAISINGEKVNDEAFILNQETAIDQVYTVIRRGKKLYGVIEHSA